MSVIEVGDPFSNGVDTEGMVTSVGENNGLVR